MDDEPYVDYHEVFPTRWEMTAAYAICCAKCHVTKHAKHFRQRVSMDKLYDRGYVGMDQTRLPRHLRGDRVVTKESKYCTQCQKTGRYRPNEMTKDEIYEAAHNGQVSLARANADVEKKRRRTSQKLATATATRWEDWNAAPWAHIKQKLTAELDYIRFALNYYTKHEDTRPEFGQMSEFLREWRIVLQGVRGQCAIDVRTQRKVDDDLTWRTLVGDRDSRRLTELWGALPLALRSRMRRLPALLDSALRNEPLLADFNPPPRPNERKPEEPIPEERMELIANIMREAHEKRNASST